MAASGWGADVDAAFTNRHSRSRTILWAVGRLGGAWAAGGHWTLELVGTDLIEGDTMESVAACFDEVIAHARRAGCGLALRLVGPNVPAGLVGTAFDEGGVSITAHRIPYEEYAAGVAPREAAPEGAQRAAFCFNAGIWGYPSWEPAVAVLLRQSDRVPVVVTAYSPVESDADEEVVDRVARALLAEGLRKDASDEAWYAWASCGNPWASRVPRPSSVRDEVLHSSQYCFALRWPSV